MVSDIIIKKISQKDREYWENLWASYLHFYGTKRSKEIFCTTFSRLIDNDYTDCEGYIAYMNGKAAGIVHCLYHIHLWQEEKTCYLQDLFVDEHFRNKGIARKLIEKIYIKADAKKIKGVYWMTQNFNINAQKLYDKIGVKTSFIKYTRP